MSIFTKLDDSEITSEEKSLNKRTGLTQEKAVNALNAASPN